MRDYVELYPRDWVPDLSRTGGDRPSSIVMIPVQSWIDAGRPESIEAWQQSLVKSLPACTCARCPVHGFVKEGG